jgi:hypothetical protein
LRLIEDGSGLIVDLAQIVQGRHSPSLSLKRASSITVGYSVWETRELLLLLPAAVKEPTSQTPDDSDDQRKQDDSDDQRKLDDTSVGRAPEW